MKRPVLIFLFLILCVYGYGQACTLGVNLSSSSPFLCVGSTVVLTAAPSGGTGPYTYIWSTGETTATIAVNKADTYSVTVSDQTTGCPPVTQNITITSTAGVDAPTATGATLCGSGTATLTATAPGGDYQWFDAPVNGNFLASGATFTTPTIASNHVYYVQTTLNGCTSLRTAVAVTFSNRARVTDSVVCAGNPATLTASGADSYIWYDSATGGNMLSTTAILITPPLLQNTTFYLVSIANGCSSDRVPVVAQVSAPPQVPTAANANLMICSGSIANLHADAPAGVIDWFTSPNGGTSLISSADYTTPALTSTTTYYVQTSLNGCISARTPVTVNVVAIPQALVNQTDTICNNSSTILQASATPSGTYNWYNAATGGDLLATGNSFTTPVLNNSAVYYVQNSNGTCSSNRAAITVVVKPPVLIPSASEPLICPGSSTTLTATSPGGTYQWYDAPTGGNLLQTGPSYTTPALAANTIFYVQTTLGGCTSARAAVTVHIIPPSAGPAVSPVAVCTGSPATLTATGAAGNYAWYDSATGGNLLHSGQVFTTPALTASTTYYVQAVTTTGCTTNRTATTVTVNPIPSAPVAGNVAAVCPGLTSTLTVISAGGTNQWYSAVTGGNLLATGNTFTTPALSANTTYYVQNVTNTCVSARTAVTATIIAVPGLQFNYPSGTVCAASANLKPVINNPAGGTFSASPAGLVFVSNTTGEINTASSTPGTYTITFASNGVCPNLTSQKVSISSSFDASFTYAKPEYCLAGTNPSPAFQGTASAGVFTASPGGLVFTNPSTGQINLSKSSTGTYTVTNTIAAAGTCTLSTASYTVTLDQPISISAGSNQTIQVGNTAQLNATGAPGTWSGGAGSFSDPTLPNAVYTPGASEIKATLTYTSNASSGVCGQAADNVVITIVSSIGAPVAAGKSICPGTSATLTATAPGGDYEWYDDATGGNLLTAGTTYITPNLTATTTYYVQTTIGGLTSNRTAVTVTVKAVDGPVVAAVLPICQGNSTTLTASGSTGTYQWYDAAVGGNLLSTTNTYVTPALVVNTSYYVQTTLGNCVSSRTQVDVAVNTAPNITSLGSGVVCSGDAQNYVITSDIATATFTWSRAQVPGISNDAVTNQTSAAINESLINTGTNSINVTYIITPLNGTCPGPAFNYVVTVFPKPIVTSAATTTFCSGEPGNYTFQVSNPLTTFSWSRDTTAGISNSAVSGQLTGTIQEVLHNTTDAPVNATYTFVNRTSSCVGTPFNLVVTVNPDVKITSPATGIACTGSPQSYPITSNVPSSIFTWSRSAVAGISNDSVTNQTTDTIKETLVNKTAAPIRVTYLISANANGCIGIPFKYLVTVNPVIAMPAVTSNSPICSGNSIQLNTPSAPGVITYTWTGPAGFTSALQNPSIPNSTTANSGTYKLFTTVNGCSSPVDSIVVTVDALPLANAGKDTIVCKSENQIQLVGKISGGTATGFWSSNGTGDFSPVANQLNSIYTFSDADKAAGSVILTLSSTSKDDCNPSIATRTITFGQIPAAKAGPALQVCSLVPVITLNGKILIPGGGRWKSSGTGTFSPSPDSLKAVYTGSAADVEKGRVQLTLRALGADSCYIATSNTTLKFVPPPTVNAGGTRYVLKGNSITLTPTVSETDVHYKWTPNTNMDNDTLKNPTITGDIDRTYTLTVTDVRGCSSSDITYIKVSPELKVLNTFTPNNDLINDNWDIDGLIAYDNASVDVFDRYGQKVFHSLGYPKPWDGNLNGKALPAGTYYYIIDTKVNNLVLKGPVTIIR